MSDDEIREAAAQAIYEVDDSGIAWADYHADGEPTVFRDYAAAAVDAVRPLIEADLRERLAAAIEAEESALFGSPEDPYQRGWSQMRGKAARIVRERP